MINEIPLRYADATIGLESTPRWQPVIHETAIEYLKNFPTYAAQGLGPFFAGIAGTGKTYAAAAILNTLAARLGNNDFSFVWVPVGETLDRLTRLADFRAERYWKLDKAIKTADIVVFDDFAHLRDYPRLRELFWIYVNARYDRLLPTIFTANIALDERWATMSNLFGEHVARRIHEMSRGLVAQVL